LYGPDPLKVEKPAPVLGVPGGMDIAVRALREGIRMTQPKTGRTPKQDAPRRRVIAIGKRVDGRWQVRTSLWRYLATTALSSQ